MLMIALAVFILARDHTVRKQREKFVALVVGTDFGLTLYDDTGTEYPCDRAGGCWVSSRMIIIPVGLDGGSRVNSVVSAELNDPDAFRRLSIICRFGFAVEDSERHNVTQFNPQGSIQ